MTTAAAPYQIKPEDSYQIRCDLSNASTRLYQLEAALQTLIEALPEAGDRRTQNGIELLRLVAECLLNEGDKLERLAVQLPA